ADSGNPETGFGGGKDRVYTLSGMAESLPRLDFGTAYGATHSFQLVFHCTTAGSPADIRGNVAELGNFTSTGPLDSYTGGLASATVNMTNHDFVTTPLAFKIH